jgi:hypothetical protein
MHTTFFDGIRSSRVLEVFVHTREHGLINRKCVPFYFWESKKYNDGKERFHMFDLLDPTGNNHLSVLPEQVIFIEMTDEYFEPLDYFRCKQKWISGHDVREYS